MINDVPHIIDNRNDVKHNILVVVSNLCAQDIRLVFVEKSFIMRKQACC